MAQQELHVVLLEERTGSGWAGLAEITCPCCGARTVYHVTADDSARAVSFWEAGPGHTVTRQSVKTP